jgi:hypothetical protein
MTSGVWQWQLMQWFCIFDLIRWLLLHTVCTALRYVVSISPATRTERVTRNGVEGGDFEVLVIIVTPEKKDTVLGK